MVDLLLDTSIKTLFDDHHGYISLYIQGYAKYLLECKKAAGTLNTMDRRGDSVEEKLEAFLATLLFLIDYYRRNITIIGVNRSTEWYIKLDQKGKLMDYAKRCIR